MSPVRVMVIAVAFCTLAVLGVTLAAGNTVPQTHDIENVSTATANEAKPSQCASLNLTGSIVVGSGTITGTTGNDLLLGSAGADTFNGGGGQDCMVGGGGNDLFNGNGRFAGDICIAGAGGGRSGPGRRTCQSVV